MSSINRKKFISLSLLGSTAFLVANRTSAQQQKPDPIEKDLVNQFVIAGHNDLEKVKLLLQQQPGVLNACWDWGGGDFETALEGAGHMGRKDIAQFLVDNGARMNIFCAAMMGRLDIVKTTLAAFPNLKTSKGPHGLQLLHHAKKGGDDALAVLDFLNSIGAA
jgi:ankyrin repeat protein